MNSIIQQYFNKIAYGNTLAPLTDPQRVLDVDHFIFLISSFLQDEDLLHFIQINLKIWHLSKGCNQLNVRVLQVRLNKQKIILDNYIQDPSFLSSKHNNRSYFYQFNNYTIQQKYFTKLQDFLRNKKVQQQSQIQIQNNQAQQKDNLNLKDVSIQSSTKVSKNDIEKLISNFYNFINEEPCQPIKEFKLNIKINDITKNLCPVVQYNRVKQLANKIKEKKQYEVIHL